MRTFRKICRWLHPELGFLTVGLTIVYGISGIAINHVHHWDANYHRSREIFAIEPVGPGTTAELVPIVLERLALTEPVKNTWRAATDELQVFVDGATLHVNLISGEVVRDGFARRPLLFELNFMHLNSGKGIWTGIADAYAGVLVLLAITGIFLVRGRQGLAGRRGVLMGLGIVLPVLYVILTIYR